MSVRARFASRFVFAREPGLGRIQEVQRPLAAGRTIKEVLHRAVIACALLLTIRAAVAAPVEPPSASTLAQQLRNFGELGSVLYVAAHPDDENNRLLPYLARGRGLRTAYLSLTRGDGGQNLIGPELGAELGVIRTQELLATRRIDGAQQFFTRAKDFGFSKDPADTLRRWDRAAVTADIVRVIRRFRPDVIITRFSPVPSGTHGHHTASAILALEAFKLAGDPQAFPNELAGLAPWQPTRILWNGFSPNGATSTAADALRLDSGGYDPLLGESFGEIGARARSMHESQGQGRAGTRGTAWDSFVLLDGTPATKDILDGVDTTWARIPGAGDIGPLVQQAIAQFSPQNPAASVPALLTIRKKLDTLPTEPLVQLKRAELDRLLQGCLGLFVESVVTAAQVVPGETFSVRHTAIARAGYPVRWIGVRYPSLKSALEGPMPALGHNEAASRETTQTLPVDAPLTQPYWLRQEGTEGMFRVDDAALIGLAENPPVFPVEQVFEIDGETLVIADEPVQVINDPVRGERRRPLEVISPVVVSWTDDLQLFTPGSTKAVTVELTASRNNSEGSLQIDGPAGWTVTPSSQPFQLAAAGDRMRLTFNVTSPATAASAHFLARAVTGDRSYDRARTEIRYEHIPVELLQRSAVLNSASFEVATRGRAIGYLPGAGDVVPEALTRMGFAVTSLTTADLSLQKLERLDAVVIGVRAFNTRTDLDRIMATLTTYAELGGAVVVQYNTANGLRSSRFAPYPVKLSDGRVTNATAPVSFLAPDHPALNTPNKITTADFDGWVQERARYIPTSWGPEFVPLISSGDPGEKPLSGTLLVAPHGRGYFVYTGLSFFRELPAGVPGAYRLFANLVSLGRAPAASSAK